MYEAELPQLLPVRSKPCSPVKGSLGTSSAPLWVVFQYKPCSLPWTCSCATANGVLLYEALLFQWPPGRCIPCSPARGRFFVWSSASPQAYFSLYRAHWPPVRCKPCSPAKGRSLERSSAPPRAVFQYKPCSLARAPVPPSLVLSCTKQCSPNGRPFGVNRAPLPEAALLYGAVLPHRRISV